MYVTSSLLAVKCFWKPSLLSRLRRTYNRDNRLKQIFVFEAKIQNIFDGNRWAFQKLVIHRNGETAWPTTNKPLSGSLINIAFFCTTSDFSLLLHFQWCYYIPHAQRSILAKVLWNDIWIKQGRRILLELGHPIARYHPHRSHSFIQRILVYRILIILVIWIMVRILSICRLCLVFVHSMFLCAYASVVLSIFPQWSYFLFCHLFCFNSFVLCLSLVIS